MHVKERAQRIEKNAKDERSLGYDVVAGWTKEVAKEEEKNDSR